MKKKVGEENARHMINMMRSLASNLPISPFHLAAADDMESLLNEVLLYRKKKEWVGLTTDEVFELSSTRLPHGLFAGLIERTLKEKNGN